MNRSLSFFLKWNLVVFPSIDDLLNLSLLKNSGARIILFIAFCPMFTFPETLFSFSFFFAASSIIERGNSIDLKFLSLINSLHSFSYAQNLSFWAKQYNIGRFALTSSLLVFRRNLFFGDIIGEIDLF
jgi:hypothetical protein